MPLDINPAYLAHLRVICESGSRPATWDGFGPDRSVPLKAAKRLEGAGLILRRGDVWLPTTKGRHAVGRVA